MFKKLRDGIESVRDSFRYNRYITSSVRPPERETVSTFLQLLQPGIEMQAWEAGFNISWGQPSTRVSVVDGVREFSKGMDVKIQRSISTVSKTTMRMTLHNDDNADDNRRGVLSVVNSGFLGTTVVLDINGPGTSFGRTRGYVGFSDPRCLDYILTWHRGIFAEAFDGPVTRVLLSQRDEQAARDAFRQAIFGAGPAPKGPGG